MTDTSWLGPAIDVRPVLADQQAAFVDLLRGLGPDDWSRPTVCPGWSVKDVAAHVLGDHIGRLSIHRDGHHVLHPRDGEAFPRFLDRINDEWVIAVSRVSPLMLVELMAAFGTQIVEFWQTVDLDALGRPVSWAGPEPHSQWLDVARDYTEYWTHHQQICDATGRPGLTDPYYIGPVLDTFLRALPHTLRDVTAPPGTVLQVSVTTPGAGDWTCTRGPDRWRLDRRPHPRPTARLELDADTAWRLCTRGITPEQAGEHARIDGDRHLATAALQIVSIIWSPPGHEASGEL
ncbi:maleylpyruvate isomerase family mycothiol-dependent enzyme [Actinomadura roseirufa]|uniref:maleylpyruvate isomerase family mycothiol-dependent enzyme n=1 Tax=Actinomadura roseirufa TaxID=2094049 RepID=UPI001041415B|nr:maleylpyruvate isomerase family mycothiol-dependent enzyme [Actinomadura roseirufa]